MIEALASLARYLGTDWLGLCVLLAGGGGFLFGLAAALFSLAASKGDFVPYAVLSVVSLVLTAILLPNFIHTSCGGQLTACKSNLKNLGTALEMYSTDHAGAYPPDMGYLTPNYLKIIPECPHAGVDTYSGSYHRSARREVAGEVVEPDAYTFYCTGQNHTSAGITAQDYPRYDSRHGLTERP
ncbi:MAG: hypothetical protein AB1758_17505 [Candidatus Eremiobacterota bacterium]